MDQYYANIYSTNKVILVKIILILISKDSCD